MTGSFSRWCLSVTAILAVGCTVYAADNAPSPAAPASNPVAPKPGVAATVDGHAISLEEVAAICLREGGATVVDRLVNSYLIDRECERRNITVPQSAVNERIERLRKVVAPATLEQVLEQRHQTMAILEDDLRRTLKKEMLVMDQVKPARMVHCRAILVSFAPAGMPITPGSNQRTEADALSRVQNIQTQLRMGKDFAELARQCSDDPSKANGGDIGVVYEGVHDVDTGLLNGALLLHKNDITKEPVKTYTGYYLIQAVSDSSSHETSEDAAYQAADRIYKERQAQFLFAPYLADLLKKANITYSLPQ